MKYTNFIDRVTELALLDSWHADKKPKLVILFGRRRVGKTELLKEFSKQHRSLYLIARQASSIDQLKHLSLQFSRFFHDGMLEVNPFQSWDGFFTYIASKCKGVPVIIDEFPYLVQSTKGLPSILQEYWDSTLSSLDIFMILCGSSVSMMETLLGYKSPIYGRRTGQVLLEPIPFFDARAFFPSLPVASQVEFYAVAGGTPAYLLEFDESKPLVQNIKENILRKQSFMSQDVEFVLREELDEPRNYFSIILSISKGNTTTGTIVNDTGLDKGTVSKYLGVLADLGIVERRVPVTEKQPRKSRRGIYHLKDNYFKFWFRYVFANPQYIEQDLIDELIEDKLMPSFNAFVGNAFEDICIEWMKRVHAGYIVGRWWDRSEEIDIVCINKRKDHAIFVEVKWSTLSSKDARSIARRLVEKSRLVDTGCSRSSYLIIARFAESKENPGVDGAVIKDLEDLALP